jgi:hypothetical protein
MRMDIKEFKAGSNKDGYQYRYFLPETVNHPWLWTDETINSLLENASLRLGELNSFSRLVPDTNMFIVMHVLKEAVVSILLKIIVLKGSIERDRILTMGKRSKQALDLFHGLFSKPLVSVRNVQELTGLTPKAANDFVQAFVDRRILTETTGFRRNRIFIFAEYVALFDA